MAVLCSFVRLFGALGKRLKAPEGAHKVAQDSLKLQKAVLLQPSATSGCIKRLGLLGGAP
eukprot:13595091-Alexandrium_andersonii.AAC.1